MLTLISNLLKTVLLFILTAVIVLVVWKTVVPTPPPVPAERLKIAEAAANQLVELLREKRNTAKSVAVLHLANDSTHCLTHAIRRRIRETGVLALADDSLKERFMTAFNLPFDVCEDEDEAMRIAEKVPQDLLVWGTLNHFETNAKGEAVIVGKLQVIDANELKSLFDWNIDMSSGVVDQQGANLKGASVVSLRLGSFLLLVLLLHAVAFNAIRKVVAKRSNNVNLALLMVISAVDSILASVLLRPVMSFLSFPCFLVIVVAFAIICELMVLSHAARLEA